MTSPLPASAPRIHPLLLHVAVAGGLVFLQLTLLPHAFLEEVGLLQLWRHRGAGGFGHLLGLTAGRPLHLVPAQLGLLLPGDGFAGMYAVLAATVAATYAAAAWAPRPLVASTIARAAFGATVALHPLWTGGWILRYLAASVSCLAVVVWAGCALRYALGRSTWWLAGGCTCLAAGLLHYQAVAAVPLLWLVVLGAAERVDRHGDWQAGRWWRSSAATAATVGATVVHATIVAPSLSDEAYEVLVTDYSPATIEASLRRLVEACTGDRLLVLTYLVTVAGSVVFAVATRRRPGRAWLAVVVGGVVATPLVATTYAGNPSVSGDPERVLLPIGLALVVVAWAVLARVVPAGGRPLAMAAGVAASFGAAASAILAWDAIGDHNDLVLGPVVEIVAATPPGATFVVADSTGRFGDEYTHLPPHLGERVEIELGRPVDLTLCTPAGVARRHPFAERLGIPTTVDCEVVVAGRATSVAGRFTVDGAVVEVLVVGPG